MKMTFDTKNMSKETERFNKALDLFFGMNPAKRYWILLAVYFAKNKQLFAIDNYNGNDFVMATMSIDLIGHGNIVEEWNQKGINSRSIVAKVDDDQKDIIDEIYYGFDVDAINYLNQQNDKSLGFWGIHQMEPTYLVEVAEILIGISQEWYNENVHYAFYTILSRAKRADDKETGMFYQPKELTELIMKLLDAQQGTVYDPYAGMCSFGVALNSNCQYYAQELSVDYVLGKLNLLLNCKTNAICEQGDSLYDWKGSRGFDYIVSIPPFGVRCDSVYKTLDRDFLFRSASDAHHKAIGIYPSSVCFDSGLLSSQATTKYLVENDYIEGIILLPSNIFNTTGIEPVIIVVNKQKAQKRAIRFVDASRYYESAGRVNKLSFDSIFSLYNSDCEFSRLVSVADIEDKGFKLYPKLYLGKEIDIPTGMQLISLNEVLTQMCPKYPTVTSGRVFSFIKKGSLNSDGIINSQDLEIREIEGSRYRAVNTDCLITRRDGHLSAKYLLVNGEEVYLGHMYQPYLVDTGLIDPMYLLTEFSKDYFKEQVSRYGAGPGGPRMSVDEFLNLKILVPSVRDQQIKMSLDVIEKNLESIKTKKEIEFRDRLEGFILNQRQRKHAVAQVLNEIIPSMENIEHFILNNESISKDSIISRRFGTTLQAYLSTVRKQLDKVASMVDNFTSQEQYCESEVIRIESFLSDYCSSKRDLNINVVYTHNYEEEEIEQEVKISRKDLTQMLDNLIANAVKYGIPEDIQKKYGLSDERRKDFQIRIETSAIHDYKNPVVIKISNNGVPVSKSISLDKLFTWGIGQGTGIGCWQVKEIAEHFGGTASYQEFPDDPDGFVCEFRIVLPLNED